MKALFGGGKKKKNTKEVPKEPAPTLGETSSNLGSRGDVIEGKIRKCNEELKPVLEQLKRASKSSKKSIQGRALNIIKRRKMYEKQLGMLQNQQFNVDQMQFNSESIQSNINMFSAMSEATTAQQTQMEKINYDDVEDLYDNMADMMADQDEINDMMQRDFGVDELDEDEMLDELNELDEELAMEEMNNDYAGSGGNKASEKNKKEEEDILNDVMN
jgi:charged multivesicular body protein 5